MKKIILIFFVSLFVILFYACDKCRYFDCISSDTSGQFRIVSKVNGNDLVFGTNSIYDKNKIKFFSLNGTDTTFFQHSLVKYSGNNYDSILKVYFLTEPTEFTFIKLNNVDIDTLTMKYVSETTKCCGLVTTISKFIYNNTHDIGGNSETRELKK